MNDDIAFRQLPAAVIAVGVLFLCVACQKPSATSAGSAPPAIANATPGDGANNPGINGSGVSSSTTAASQLLPSSLDAGQTLAALLQAAHGAKSASSQRATELHSLFARLRALGKDALPAIHGYLQRGDDISLAPGLDGTPADYASVRLGLIDLLASIGGPDAASAAVQDLQTAGDPAEVAALTSALERIAPGQYRDAESTALLDILGQVNGGQLTPGEAIPVFEAAQSIGGPNLIAALQKAAPDSGYYATLALAGLKDGAGIPALIQLAQTPAITGLGTGDYALRPLAQAATEYPAAAQALIDQASQNTIPDKAWPAVAAALAGTYMQYGNALFGSTTPTVDWSPASIQQRIDLLTQIAAATQSQAGHQALNAATAALTQKLPK